ncbi:MAG: hypothetical protein ABIS67_05660 [Candidatus Eisenbacteria bacterium]
MRRTWTLAALFLFGLAAQAHAREIRIDQRSMPVPRDRQVRIEFPVGELTVEASTGPRVTLDLSARCKGRDSDDCRERAERIEVDAEETGGELRIKVKGYPKIHTGGFNLQGVLRLPRELALRVEMGVGEIRISGIEGDLDVDLGVGEADIRTPGRAVRSIEVATGVGDASVMADGGRVRRRSFISSSASWADGRGRSSVNLKVGVGDATVRVD